MTYRQPAFMVNNYGAGSISDITQIVGFQAGGLSNADKRAFFDGRVSSIGSYVSTGTSAGIRWDAGVIPSPAANRLVIPKTHGGFIGNNLSVYHDSSPYPSPTLVSFSNIADGNTIDLTLSSGNERYWIIQQSSISVGHVTTARGFWLGTYSQLSGSAHVDPAFELGWKAQLVDTDYPGGVAVAQISPPRRTFSLRVRDIDPASSDYSILDGVMQSREKPFWYWPPDDTDPGPFYVRHSNEPKRVQDFGAPTQALRYTFDFDLIEDNL
jgi:hypothetical protein